MQISSFAYKKLVNAQFYDKTLYVEHSIDNIYL